MQPTKPPEHSESIPELEESKSRSETIEPDLRPQSIPEPMTPIAEVQIELSEPAQPEPESVAIVEPVQPATATVPVHQTAIDEPVSAATTQTADSPVSQTPEAVSSEPKPVASESIPPVQQAPASVSTQSSTEERKFPPLPPLTESDFGSCLALFGHGLPITDIIHLSHPFCRQFVHGSCSSVPVYGITPFSAHSSVCGRRSMMTRLMKRRSKSGTKCSVCSLLWYHFVPLSDTLSQAMVASSRSTNAETLQFAGFGSLQIWVR